MDEKSRKQIERIRASLETDADRDRFDRTTMQIDEMPKLMAAFDAWCATQDINRPVQTVLGAYIANRNLCSIKSSPVQRAIVKWIVQILLTGICAIEFTGNGDDRRPR